MKREEVKKFIEEYESTANFLEALIKNNASMQKKFPALKISSRVKTVDSVLKKLLRKELTISELNKLTDIAGVRIVVRFYEDIARVCEMICASGITIIEERDYINQIKKKSGYRAYHFIVEQEGRLAEIQIRTFAMDIWANAEHNIRYKPTLHVTSKIEERLTSAVEYAHALDEVTSFLYKEALKLAEDDGTMEILKALDGNRIHAELREQLTLLLLEMRLTMFDIEREFENEYT